MNKFLRKIGWYPVTTFGWLVSGIYAGLLIYIVLKINADLYTRQFELFAVSILSIFFIVLVLLFARLAGEQPFRKHGKK